MNIEAIEKIEFRKINKDNYYFAAMDTQDKLCIGTKYYQGLAYFWNHEYRHVLRDASYSIRKKVHNSFVKAGLHPSGLTRKHDAIINSFFPGENYSSGK